MKTPIKNTLFRFANLRSPELLEEKREIRGFIFFPETYKSNSFFYNSISPNANASQRDALNDRIKPFEESSEIYQSDQQIKSEFQSIYNFSVWLIRNKGTCTEQELSAKVQTLNFTAFAAAKMIRLWDNLFYQVISNKSFYTKELIMQILLANHVLTPIVQQVVDPENYLQKSKSKIVLPKEMFFEDKLKKSSAERSSLQENTALAYPSAGLKKQQIISLEQRKIKNAEALKKELQRSEKKYRKDHQAAFALAKKNHEALIAPILKQYEIDVEQERKRWCSAKSPESIYDPKDICNQPDNISKPKLPDFSFSYDNQINAARISTELTENALVNLSEILGYESEESLNEKLMDDFETYDELYNHLDSIIKKSNKIIFDNTEIDQKKKVSIGGILVPVKRDWFLQPFHYQLCPKPVGRLYNFDFAVAVPNNSWQVANVNYSIKYESGTSVKNGHYVQTRIGNTIYLKDLFNNGLNPQQIQNVESFSMEISFSNGKTLVKEIEPISINSCAYGSFPFMDVSAENSVPNQFGYQQIGIADYKKVEQSVQCYVAGEVSHIENVMASEYREKSTRRLRRTEDTTTSSSETEREQLSDTTSVSRFEMQSEVAKLLSESKDFQAATYVDAKYPNVNFGANAGFASHTSKEESTRQAMTTAQEITERALDRVVSKVKQERIVKVIEEFEENNMHGYDNRGTDKHVSGVYRWVDKLYKNQIVNYGKRLMFEFMIPQPAKLHDLAISEAEKEEFTLEIPVDPRTSSQHALMTIDDMVNLYDGTIDQEKINYWAAKYNVEIKAKPENEFFISKSYSKENSDYWAQSADLNIDIPDNYRVISFSGFLNTSKSGEHGEGNHQNHTKISIAGMDFPTLQHLEEGNGAPFRKYKIEADGLNICKSFGISLSSWRTKVYGLELTLKCSLNANILQQWQQETFNAIIAAYEEKLSEYNEKKKEFESKEKELTTTNPGFYRKIENMILRKNCISYMMDRKDGSLYQYGRKGLYDGDLFSNLEVKTNQDLDTYSSFVKFMEQAFEWENISYNFYPYYWADRDEWNDLYNLTEGDSIFHSFLQSGMARVIAPVRPGFEDAVQFYMATGMIWSGGQVPVIGDPLFLSIVEELKEIEGKPEGKAWITRVPTALTIIQAGSIGLEVVEALPCDCDDKDDFENPDEIPCNSDFKKLDNTIGGIDQGISAMEIKPFQVQ